MGWCAGKCWYILVELHLICFTWNQILIEKPIGWLNLLRVGKFNWSYWWEIQMTNQPTNHWKSMWMQSSGHTKSPINLVTHSNLIRLVNWICRVPIWCYFDPDGIILWFQLSTTDYNCFELMTIIVIRSHLIISDYKKYLKTHKMIYVWKELFNIASLQYKSEFGSYMIKIVLCV